MAYLRRHFGYTGLFALLACGGLTAAAVWVWPRSLVVVMQPAPHEPLDAVQQAEVEGLRAAAGLDAEVLAALNLDAERLVSTLEAVREWHGENRAQLNEAVTALSDAKALVRHYQSAMNQGQDVAQQLTAAKAAVVEAQGDYDALLAACRTAVMDGYSQGELALAATMRQQASLAMPYRALTLDAAQRNALQGALTRHSQRLALARNAQDQETLHGVFVAELESAIGESNIQAIASLREYLGPASERVVEATGEVFPQELGQG